MGTFKTPILFITYNRPRETSRVLSRIKQIKPQKLYIASDGPKDDDQDNKKLQKVREILNTTNQWNCTVEFLYQKNNLGCKKAVSQAINWFFDHVEEGIILEDDCLPDMSFFFFCQQLLEKYRNDKRIMLISGSNFQQGNQRGEGSYYFSKYSAIWGWATWKRVWRQYDVNMSSFPDFQKKKLINSVFSSKIEQFFWNYVFSNMYKGLRDTWDHQLAYTVMSNNGLAVVPNKNIVTNIGFNDNSTRTTNTKHPLANMKTEKIGHIFHPVFIVADRDADRFMFNNIYLPMIINQGIDMIKNFTYVTRIFKK